jgi:hypothetical protein
MPSNDVTGKRFAACAREEIAQGDLAGKREVVFDALRAEILKGSGSGAGIPAERVFAEVRAALAAGGAVR